MYRISKKPKTSPNKEFHMDIGIFNRLTCDQSLASSASSGDHPAAQEECVLSLKYCSSLGFSQEVLDKLTCEDLVKIGEQAPNIKSINLCYTKALTSLSFLEQCSQLLHINLTGSSVGNLEGVNYCKNLETLNLRWCQGIQDISQIRECNQLKKLYLCHLDRVRDLKPLESLSKLSELHLTDCKKIESLEPLSRLRKIETISLMGCTGITDVSCLQNSAHGLGGVINTPSGECFYFDSNSRYCSV